MSVEHARQPAANRKSFGLRLLAVVELIERMVARRRSRLALLSLTDDQLKDIGISRADAYREGIRGFR
jgi:uncharacterized protein YjiS (DUF1127 family)